MVQKFISRPTVLARFSLLMLFVTALIAVVLAWRLQSTLQNDVLWAIAENTQKQANSELGNELRPEDFSGKMDPARYNEIAAIIDKTLLNKDIARIKIWNQGGVLIYSDDKSVVRKRFLISDALQSAFNGQMVTDISSLERDENVNERNLYSHLFEVYVPLRLNGSDEVIGAYEVYYDLNKLEPRLAHLRNTVWSGVAIGFLFTYAILFFLIRNASKELIHRNEENQRLLTAEREQRQLSDTLGRVGLALSEVLDLRKLLDLICEESIQVFGADSALLWLIEGEELVGFAAHGKGSDQFIGMRFALYDQNLLGARVIRERRPILVNDAPSSRQVNRKLAGLFEIKSILGAPLIKGERTLGAMMILDTHNLRRFDTKDLQKASIFGSYAAIAIENAQLFEEARQRFNHERALREIDVAITSNHDLQFTLDTVLKQTSQQLRADACDILLLNKDTQTLVYARGKGFSNEEVARKSVIDLTQNKIGKAVLEHRTLYLLDITNPEEISERAELIHDNGFSAYFAAPLVAKERVLGVLEVFQRKSDYIRTDWLNFLDVLAGQAAIAIENATLLTDLQTSNAELELAYEAAIEGWARALELRDKETEGHTRRVTEMTLTLAAAMQVDEKKLGHIRRGSLLHDIGKMAVPDAILLKPDELSPEETEIMRQHPQNAYKLLSPISYLREDLDIPYCHHEKWDGTGYPRGLKGEEIPLSARIFAVADVYDALAYDRPYRQAWTSEMTLEYIRGQSNSHFDPEVVECFMKIMNKRIID